MSTIKIAVRSVLSSSPGLWFKKEIDAELFGLFAVHGDDAPASGSPQLFQVTHVPTGRLVREMTDRKSARKLARALSRQRDWDFATLKEFKLRREQLHQKLRIALKKI